MKRIIKTLIALTLLINLGCNKNEKNSEKPIQQNIAEQVFATVKPKIVSYADEITAIGILSSKNEYQLSFIVGGIINYLDVNEGDYVKKGETLARINQTSVNVTTNRLTLAFEKAQRDYERVEALYQDKVVTLENLENAKTGLDNAKLQLESALFNQQYATIKAPSSGKIQSVLAQKNEMIQAGTPIIIMGSDKGGKVLKTNLADIDVVKVKMKDSCKIEFDAFPNAIFSGYVSEISGTSDRYTGTYEIEIYVKDSKKILKSGFIGKVVIKSSLEKEYIQIPIETIVFADEMIGEISVLVEGKKRSKTVKIAKILGDKLLISEGLSKNEILIIN